MTDKEKIKAIIKQYADRGERLYNESYNAKKDSQAIGYWDGNRDCANLLLRELDDIQDMQEVPILLTEEILKINGFKLYAPPRYKEAFWSKIYEDKEENKYVFDIYMEQRVEHLLTVTPLATSDGKGHPDCHLPHPETVRQLQNSLRLFGIEDIIRV